MKRCPRRNGRDYPCYTGGSEEIPGLQIPVLYGNRYHSRAELHCWQHSFPQPLAMAATWNPELMLRGSQIAAAETRKAGIPWSFSPVLDAGRQPLWSRLWETFGEDTYLATVMGVALFADMKEAIFQAPAVFLLP